MIRRGKAIAAALLAVSCAAVFFGRGLLADPPFTGTRRLSGPSGVFGGPDGGAYIIDDGKRAVLSLSGRGELIRELRAGEGAFNYASLVADGGDGSLYVSDALYSGQGTALAAERVFRYGAGSARAEPVHEIVYAGGDAPRQNGRITDMQARGDILTLAIMAPPGAIIRDINVKTGEISDNSFDLGGVRLADLSFHPETKLPVFTVRTGQIGTVGADGEARIVAQAVPGEVPWRVSAEGGYIYYGELVSSSVKRIGIDGGDARTVADGGGAMNFARVTEGTLYVSGESGFYAGTPDGSFEYRSAVPLAYGAARGAVWLALAAAAAIAFGFGCKALAHFAIHSRGETFQRVAIVLFATVSVCALSSYLIISRMNAARAEDIMRQLRLFGDVMAANVDCELLEGIDGADDYGGREYTAMKAQLDRMTDLTYSNGLYYYYAVYVTDGEIIYGVMDYEDTVTARHPVYAYGQEGYTDVFSGGVLEVGRETSSYGTWAFAARPIYDAGGRVAGIIEVGANYDEMDARNRAIVRELVLTVASATAVLVMLIIEIMLLLDYFERRSSYGRGRERRRSARLPLRSLVFVAYAADSIQDAFVAVYADRLYAPVGGLPQEIGAALPMSVQLLAMAAASFICGAALRRGDTRRAVLAGLFAEMAGFALCAAVETYAALIAGKALIGCGLGLVAMSANSAAAQERGEMRAGQFASIAAGILAGVTVGAGIGSVALSFWGFRQVFALGAAIIAPGAVLAVYCKQDRRMPRGAAPDRVGIGFADFIRDREIIGFLLLVLAPFMMSLAFRGYFFPIFSVGSGVSETNIGRLYMLSGMIVIYAGPQMTRVLISRLGGRWTVVFASALACGAILLFAAAPTVRSAVAGIMLLSLAASFGYAAQSDYYSGRKAVKEYGESEAMGVYSIFDNGGQILGPIVYSAAMLAGQRTAAGIVGAAIGGLLAVFAISGVKKRG
ncbi:MAG: MFS transporter [Oscillospiraceae bacterium]|jgi:predicted MFS family arabinose efflux permease|nr:MFS transporter [Oscillospiraceae bacterium]